MSSLRPEMKTKPVRSYKPSILAPQKKPVATTTKTVQKTEPKVKPLTV